MRWPAALPDSVGNPMDHVYEDRELFADFLATYYIDHEPESCFLFEVDGQICRYLLESRKPVQNQRLAVLRSAGPLSRINPLYYGVSGILYQHIGS
jgi:hypothetical protein